MSGNVYNPACGLPRWGDLTGKPSSLDDIDSSLAAKQDTSAKGQASGYASLDGDGKVPSAQLPAGSAEWGGIEGTLSDQTDLALELAGKAEVAHDHDAAYAAIGHDHSGVYEPADAAIQTHVAAAHAPSNAQKNSDITKAEIEAKLTGEISSHSHAGGGGEAFPVGSVFISVVSTDPATLLGYGTWEAFAAGRMLIGIDSGDADFDTAEETGGAKTSSAVVNHTHTVDVMDPGHTHEQTAPTSASSGAVRFGADTNASGADGEGNNATQSATTGITATTANPAGGVASFSIMPPYIVVYMFQRTA